MVSLKLLVSKIAAYMQVSKKGRNQMYGRVSVTCWHATPVENTMYSMETFRDSEKVKCGVKVIKLV